MTAEVCKPLKGLTSVKAVWIWNRTYQEIYKRIQSLVKEDIYIKYYNVRKPLYIDDDISEVGLGTTLLR